MMLIVVWGGFVFELWSQIWDLDTFLRLKMPECERATECQLPTVANNNYFYLLLENAQILQFIFLFTIICKDEQLRHFGGRSICSQYLYCACYFVFVNVILYLYVLYTHKYLWEHARRDMSKSLASEWSISSQSFEARPWAVQQILSL